MVSPRAQCSLTIPDHTGSFGTPPVARAHSNTASASLSIGLGALEYRWIIVAHMSALGVKPVLTISSKMAVASTASLVCAHLPSREEKAARSRLVGCTALSDAPDFAAPAATSDVALSSTFCEVPAPSVVKPIAADG